MVLAFPTPGLGIPYTKLITLPSPRSLPRPPPQLGPDLRATVPLVMNFSVTGGLELSGPAHPDKVGLLRRVGCNLVSGFRVNGAVRRGAM